MSFYNRLTKITARTVHKVETDLGFGDGVEKLYFRELDYADRQRIFVARGKDDGSIDVRSAGLYLGAEIVCAMLCDENGDAVVSLDQVRKWDGALVDKISSLALEAAKPTAEEKSENPSTAQS